MIEAHWLRARLFLRSRFSRWRWRRVVEMICASWSFGRVSLRFSLLNPERCRRDRTVRDGMRGDHAARGRVQ